MLFYFPMSCMYKRIFLRLLYIHMYIYVRTCTQKLTLLICYDAQGLTPGCRRVAVSLHVNQHLTGNVVDWAPAWLKARGKLRNESVGTSLLDSQRASVQPLCIAQAS